MTSCGFEITKQNISLGLVIKKNVVNLTSRSSVMSTFSAPSKPDAFQPIEVESVERPCGGKYAVPLKKNRSYYGSGNSMESSIVPDLKIAY